MRGKSRFLGQTENREDFDLKKSRLLAQTEGREDFHLGKVTTHDQDWDLRGSWRGKKARFLVQTESREDFDLGKVRILRQHWEQEGFGVGRKTYPKQGAEKTGRRENHGSYSILKAERMLTCGNPRFVGKTVSREGFRLWKITNPGPDWEQRGFYIGRNLNSWSGLRAESILTWEK